MQIFARASDEIREAGTFGSYPVRVLTATVHGFVPEGEQLWRSLLGSLADEADDGEQRIFEGAGHYLQLEQPNEVAEVIRSFVPAPSDWRASARNAFAYSMSRARCSCALYAHR